MVEPPYWLTNKGVDEIDAGEYDSLRTELLAIISAEEEKTDKVPLRLSKVMNEAWVTGTFWYSLALSSPSGLFSLFYDHIQPLLSEHSSEEIDEIMPFYWGRDVGKFVATKLADKRRYDSELRQAFAASSSDSDVAG